MSQQQHLPEPWRVESVTLSAGTPNMLAHRGGFDVDRIVAANGNRFQIVWQEVETKTWDWRACEIDALSRIAACVNALAGVPDDVLHSPRLNAFLLSMPAMHNRKLLEWEPEPKEPPSLDGIDLTKPGALPDMPIPVCRVVP